MTSRAATVRRLFSRGLAPWGFLLMAVPAAAAEPNCGSSDISEDPCVTIEIVFDRGYSGDQYADNQLNALERLVPPREIEFPAGASVSGIVTKEFGLGQQAITEGVPHQLRSQLYEMIGRMNGVTDLSSIKSDRLKIPALPSFVSQRKAGGTLLGMAKLKGEAVGHDDELAVALSEANREATALEARRFTVPRSRAAAILADPELAPFAPSVVDTDGALSSAAVFELADQGLGFASVTSITDFLTEAEASALQARLALPRQNDVQMLVIDSCWPTAGERDEAYAMLNLWAARVNSRLGSDYEPLPLPGVWTEPSNKHCQGIKRALDDLEKVALDAPPEIPVSYIPLTKEQMAEPFLYRLLSLHHFVRAYLTNKDKWNSYSSVEIKRLRRRLEKENVATTIAKVIPPEWGPGGRVSTSSLLIDAAFRLSEFFSTPFSLGVAPSEPITRFFLNASWTFDAQLVSLEAPGNADVMLIAAFGNNGQPVGQDEERADFARRTYRHQAILAVANTVRGRGRVCCSNYFPDDMFDDAPVLAFNGALTPDAASRPCGEGACGTSYAAPRVAWLLTALEATRVARVPIWSRRLSDAVRSSRVADDCPWRGYLELEKLIAKLP